MLFALCGHYAGLAADADADAHAATLAAACMHLGLAFQAADDVADLRSGDDLRERNPNLAVVLACNASDVVALKVARGWAQRALGPDDLASLIALITGTGAIDACRAVIEAELAAADALLAPLARSDAGHAALATIRAWAGQLAHTLTTPAPAAVVRTPLTEVKAS